MIDPPRTLFEMLVPRAKMEKDTGAGGLLSGLASTLEESGDRAYFEGIIGREFANLHPDNPIKKLSVRDKIRLLALVGAYDFVRWSPTHMEVEERVTTLAADAAKMACRFDDASGEASGLDFSGAIGDECRELAERLRQFGRIVSRLNNLGKPGQKQKISANESLVTCSEFISRKIGCYHDEHFAELLQGREVSHASNDLSGEAIRKKRENLRKKYPDRYEAACSAAEELTSSV